MGKIEAYLQEHAREIRNAKPEDFLRVESKPGKLARITDTILSLVWEQWLLPICCEETLEWIQIEWGRTVPGVEQLTALRERAREEKNMFITGQPLFKRIGVTRESILARPDTFPIRYQNEGNLLYLLGLEEETSEDDVLRILEENWQAVQCVWNFLQKMNLSVENANRYFIHLLLRMSEASPDFRNQFVVPLFEKDERWELSYLLFMTLSPTEMKAILDMHGKEYQARVCIGSSKYDQVQQDSVKGIKEVWDDVDENWVFRFSLYAKSSPAWAQEIFKIRKKYGVESKIKLSFYHLTDLAGQIPEEIFAYIDTHYPSLEIFNKETDVYLILSTIYKETTSATVREKIELYLEQFAGQDNNLAKIWSWHWQNMVEIWNQKIAERILSIALQKSPGQSPNLNTVNGQWYQDNFPELTFNLPIVPKSEPKVIIEAY